MQCDGVGVALPEPGGGICGSMRSTSQGARELLKKACSRQEKMFPALTSIRTGQAIRVTSSELSGDHLARAIGVKTICHLPLTTRKGVLGVLTLGSLDENAFSDEDDRLPEPGCEPGCDRC